MKGMNYFQIEEPMNNYLGHTGGSYRSYGLDFSFKSLIFLIKKKKKILNLGLLEVKAHALDVTSIPKKSAKARILPWNLLLKLV